MAESADDRYTTLYRGKFLQLVKKGSWEFVERVHVDSGGSAVGIAALTDKREMILVEQFRVPVGKPCIEMPAGLVADKDLAESWQRAANRELLEETGYSAESMEILVEGPTSPGLSSETMKIVRARGLKKVGPPTPDECESITVYEVPLTDIRDFLAQKVAAGALVDPKVYAALYFFQMP